MEKKKMATREAYGLTLASLAQENEQIVVLDADLSGSTQTQKFASVAPERFTNCGIAESDMIDVAAGMSTCGKIPFASTFAVFAAGRAFEQIRNTVCHGNLNVKIAATHAGITVGEDGGSHQAIEDISLMRTLPHMTVLCPADGVATEWAIRWAADYVGPVYIRLGRLAADPIYEPEQQFRMGKGNLLRSGSDIVLFACGMMVAPCLAASDLLAKEGIKAAVVDMHTIKPFDTELTLDMASSCGAALSVEEHSILGGLGSAVAETLAEGGLGIPFQRVGIMDTFGQSGSPAALLEYYGLDSQSIANKAKVVLAKKK